VTLAGLLQPLSIRDAIAALDDGDLRHVEAAEPGRLGELMNWEVAAQVIQLRAGDAAALRVFKNGAPVPAEMVKGSRTAAAASGSGLRQLIRQGVSLVMGDIAATTPRLQQLAYDAERGFGCSLTLGMIATFGEGRALEPHFDEQDILAFQVEGEKTWSILGDQRAKLPFAANRPSPPEEVTREIRMRPGDALLLPHGTWHSCWSEHDSLQLSILLRRNRGADVLDWLLRTRRTDEGLWRPAPLARDPERLAAFEAHWKARMHRLVDEASIAAFLADGDRRVAIPVHLDLDRDIDAAAPETVVSLLVRRPIPLPSEPQAPLRMGGAKVASTPAIRRAVEVLNAAAPVTVGDLVGRLSPDLDAAAVTAAIKALDAAGLVSLSAP
jgi:hypothetical protein